jgi:hypothetical protein
MEKKLRMADVRFRCKNGSQLNERKKVINRQAKTKINKDTE